MKKQGQRIEVRFVETAEFHVTPLAARFGGDECPEGSE